MGETMPNPKAVIITVVGLAVVILLLEGASWLFQRPLIIVAIVALIAGAVYMLKKRTDAKNRV